MENMGGWVEKNCFYNLYVFLIYTFLQCTISHKLKMIKKHIYMIQLYSLYPSQTNYNNLFSM